jgi:hypothetical protein
MNSFATTRFWGCYQNLPEAVRRLADKAFKQFIENPRNPSLRFKKIQGSSTLYSARVGEHYRALGHLRGDEITWVWIGSHAEYDKLIGFK